MLTDTKVRQAKAKDRPYKLSDARGLYLYVSTKGAKSWRYDYRLSGRRETLTVGRYPEVPVAEARERLEAARKQVEKGESPSLARKREKQAAVLGSANTFEAMAEAWHAEMAPHRSEVWRGSTRRWLDKKIYPAVGSMPINQISPPDVLSIIKGIAKGGHARSAEYVRQTMVRVFEFAIRNLRAKHNPAREVRGAITLPAPKNRRPLSIKEIPHFIEKLDAYSGRLSTKLAIKLLMLTFVRKSELVNATWDEFDLEAAEWRIPGERMKMRDPHIVPLSRQAVKILKELKRLSGSSTYVLPNIGNLRKPMGQNTFNKAFSQMDPNSGFTPHGLRATASTILNEQGFRPDVIERQLAHAERNRVRAAYNQADYLADRKMMMQSWADYIDGLSSGAKVVNIGRSVSRKKARRNN